MTPEERAHISNGIWLCSNCAVLIDRDEARFSVAALHGIRAEHEALRRIGKNENQVQGDIIGVGSGIVAVGRVFSTGPSGFRVGIDHLVDGSGRDLLTFASNFARQPPEGRYVLMNELGYGGLLEGAPTIERDGGKYEMQFRLQQSVPRRDATAKISSLSAETMQLIHGMDAYVQHFEQTLGAARGTMFFEPEGGSDLSDLYWRYGGSPWFQRLAMMEMIRLASIPYSGQRRHAHLTSLACVNRINSVDLLDYQPENQKLRMQVEFDLEGAGLWTGELAVFISTPEQLSQGRANAKHHYREIERI